MHLGARGEIILLLFLRWKDISSHTLTVFSGIHARLSQSSFLVVLSVCVYVCVCSHGKQSAVGSLLFRLNLSVSYMCVCLWNSLCFINVCNVRLASCGFNQRYCQRWRVFVFFLSLIVSTSSDSLFFILEIILKCLYNLNSGRFWLCVFPVDFVIRYETSDQMK